MKKSIDSKKVMKSILSKEEIRFAEYYDIKIYPTRNINWYTKTTEYTDEKECQKACKARVKAIREKIALFVGGGCYVNIDGKLHKTSTLQEWAEADKKRTAFINRLNRENAAIDAMLQGAGLYGVRDTICRYRVGENTSSFTARYGENGIKCTETREDYCKSCQFKKIVRSFELNVRKGWNVAFVGGLLTFYKGTIDKHGIACEWIEQGAAIDSFRTVKGFLVYGEHIEAKNLKEAQRINANHRAMELARIMRARKRQERRKQQKENGTLKITFNDSIASGNCRPGTMQFKQMYEAAIGHEAKSITIADLRKYGKMFGVEYYAERVIEYAINH